MKSLLQSFRKQFCKDPKIRLKNYNFEEFGAYTQERKQQLKESHIPLRKVRRFDKPKYSTDTTNYLAFRTYDKQIFIAEGKGAVNVKTKFEASPKLFRKTFGPGLLPIRFEKSATKEFDFYDSNLDSFLVLDYRQTQNFWGPVTEENIQRLRREKKLYPRDQLKEWPTEEEFWKSDDPYIFWVFCHPLAEFMKFRAFLLAQMEKYKNQELSYEEELIQKFGPLDFQNTYDQKTVDLEIAVHKYDRKTLYDEPNPQKTALYQGPFEKIEKLGKEYRI